MSTKNWLQALSVFPAILLGWTLLPSPEAGPVQPRVPIPAMDESFSEASSPVVDELRQIRGRVVVDPARTREIRAPFAGRIVSAGSTGTAAIAGSGGEVSRTLHPGDRVKKGQRLATLWCQAVGESKSHYVAAASRLMFDEASLERLGQQHASAATLAETRRHCLADRTSLKQAEQALQTLGLGNHEIETIRAAATRLYHGEPDYSRAEDWAEFELQAPEDGVLLTVNLKPGNTVPEGTVLFQWADTSELMLHVPALGERYESLAHRDFAEQTWQIRSSDERDLRVFAVGAVGFSQAGLVARFDNSQAGWQPGRAVIVTLPAATAAELLAKDE